MRSIRGKLFVSIGAILLVIAILSYFIPKFYIEKDIEAASSELTEKFTESAKKVQLAFTTFISSRFIEQTTQLETLSKLLSQQQALLETKKSLKEIAAEIINYVPQLSYIQIQKGQEAAIIAPEEGKSYIPSWTEIDEKTLAIRLSDGELFFAQKPPVETKPNQAFYLLYPPDPETASKELTFKPFDREVPLLAPTDSPYQLFDYLLWKQNRLIDRALMISLLVSEPANAVGMLAVSKTFEKGFCILSREIFPTEPLIKDLPASNPPYLLLQQRGKTYSLDALHSLSVGDFTFILGYSLSNIAKEVAAILQKPLLLSEEGSGGLLVFPDGSQAHLSTGTFDLKEINYGERHYQVTPHHLAQLTISILTPVGEATSIKQLMTNLRESLVDKISVNLMSITAVVFFIGLFLLARISKKMTKPITQLAKASEEIGRGNLVNISLPKVEKRRDEIAVLTHSFEEMVSALRDREKIRGALNKVVSKEVAEEILKSDIELGGEERVVTLLFSDIRNFTPLSNHFAPKALIQMLNKYMTHMCHIIDLTHGVVDKFVGDEIMALYGAPLFIEDQADRALEAAIQMMTDLNTWNRQQLEAGKKPLEIGIGVHTGAVCTGNMGAENRLNYTVIGANVNLTSRICAAAKPMQILVTESTIKALKHPEKYTFEPVPPMRLKGFEEPVSLFEVIC